MKPILWLCSALALSLLAACGSSATSKTAADVAVAADVSAVDVPAADVAAADVASADVPLPGKATFETADPAAVVVLDANVMCSFCKNSDHPEWVQDWSARVLWWHDVILRHDPDLMALQEFQEIVPTDPVLSQPEQIIKPENAYDFEYYHYKPGDLFEQNYDDATVFWKKARFDKLDTGVFWLSPTPDASYSTGFHQPQEPRLVVWVLLHDKTNNRDFYFANTHFDNNAPSQKLSSPLVLQRFAALPGPHPILFGGDFNSAPDTDAYKTLVQGVDGKGMKMEDARYTAKTAAVFSNVKPPPMALGDFEDIDHIFLTGATFTVSWWVLDLWRYGDLLQAPSDHNGAIVTSVKWP